MNIKRTISLSFLLFVNMVILAHSVVFHHHSLLSAVVCAGNHEEDCNDAAQHDHDSENCCTVENCFSTSLFTKADVLTLAKPVFGFDIIINHIPANIAVQITDLAGLPFRQKPYLLSCHTDYISQSLGLRAPPAC